MAETHHLPPRKGHMGEQRQTWTRTVSQMVTVLRMELLCEQVPKGGARVRSPACPWAPETYRGQHGATGARGTRPSLADPG